jgi:hypothetical protein
VATCLRSGMKGVCRHVNTPMLKVTIENEEECVKSVGKVYRTLGVKLSQPYIGVCVRITASVRCDA